MYGRRAPIKGGVSLHYVLLPLNPTYLVHIYTSQYPYSKEYIQCWRGVECYSIDVCSLSIDIIE